MDLKRSFYQFSLLFSSVTLLSLLLRIFSTGHGDLDGCYILWLSCSLVCMIMLSIFLRKERALNGILFLMIGCYILQLVSSFLLYGIWGSWSGIFITMLFWLSGYYILFGLLTKAIPPQKLINYFDGTLALLIISTLLYSSGLMTFSQLLPPAGAAFLMLICLMLCRMASGTENFVGKLALLGGSLLIGCIAGGIALLASGGIRSGLLRIWNVILWSIHWTGQTITRFLEWLFSLFPPEESEIIQALPTESMVSIDITEEMSSGGNGLIFIAILITLAIFTALFFLFRTFGKMQFRRISFRKPETRLKRSRSFWFRKKLMHLFQCIRYQIQIWLRADTPQGAFARVEQDYRRKKQGRTEQETCHDFLMRVRKEHPMADAQLQRLADDLDQALYGGHSTWSRTDSKELLRTYKQKS